jgi:hypothetical protein
MSGERIIVSADAFGQFRVRELSERDFALSSSTPIALLSPKCHIVLFYEPVSVDPALIELWQRISADVAGPVIAAVNTSARTEVMEAFMNVGADLDNPLNQFSGFGNPTILVYRSRWPQAFYNGQLSYDAIKKWIIVLACKPGYREPYSLYHGISSVNYDPNYVRDPRIQNFPYPTSSRDFTALLGENPRDDTIYVDQQIVDQPAVIVAEPQTTVTTQEEVQEVPPETTVVEEQIVEEPVVTTESSPVATVTTTQNITAPAITVRRRGCRDVGFNV